MRAPDPCPYCHVKVDLYPETRNLGIQVECANCGVRGPFKPTMEEAVDAFDRMRPAAPPVAEDADALLDALVCACLGHNTVTAESASARAAVLARMRPPITADALITQLRKMYGLWTEAFDASQIRAALAALGGGK